VAKGSDFERQIAKALSLWWTDCERDDVFWRTQTSGARATTRSKVGKTTYGQYGDIQAVDPIGQPLMDCCTIEIKRGYGKWSILDIVDKGPHNADQPFEKFLDQVEEDRVKAGTYFVMLIGRRDKRKAVVCLPRWVFEGINENYAKTEALFDHIVFMRRVGKAHQEEYIILQFQAFLDWCAPEYFEDWAANLHQGRELHTGGWEKATDKKRRRSTPK